VTEHCPSCLKTFSLRALLQTTVGRKSTGAAQLAVMHSTFSYFTFIIFGRV